MSITAHIINAKGICTHCGMKVGLEISSIAGERKVWQHGSLEHNGYVTVHMPINKTVTNCWDVPTANQALFDIWLLLQEAEFEQGATKLNTHQCVQMLDEIRRKSAAFLLKLAHESL